MDVEITTMELCEFMTYMQDILHYPIPNRHCAVGDDVQRNIILVMEKSLNVLQRKIYKTKQLTAQSLLGFSIKKYLECTLLIGSNRVFMKDQIVKTLVFAHNLKEMAYKVPRNFH